MTKLVAGRLRNGDYITGRGKRFFLLLRSAFKTLFSHTTVTVQNMYTYRCHNTKHVHVPLSQHKTFTRTVVTIQNMYTYRCHNTKHVHIPLSQYKTCTRTAVTVQNMYTYRCHSTKHVHVPPSQYKTCDRLPLAVRVPQFEKHCSQAFRPTLGPTKPPI